MKGQPEIAEVGPLSAGRRRTERRVWPSWATRVARVVLPLSLYWLAASSTLEVFMTAWGKDVGKTFAETLELRRKRPFAYRVLMPLTLNAAAAITPEWLQDRVLVAKPYDGPTKPWYSRVERARRRYEWGPGHDFEYWTMYNLLFASLVLTQVVWWRLLSHGSRHGPLLAAFGPALAMIALPLTFAVNGYIYDFPEILLASLCLCLFAERRWVAYYVVFALAVLNKESSVLWSVWCLALLPEGKKLFAKHASLHLLIGGVPFLLVRGIMASRPGVGAEMYLMQNVRYWLEPGSWIGFLDLYAPALPMPAPGNLLVYPPILLLAFYAWRQKDLLMRVAFVGTAILITPLFIVFGFQNEVRVFGPCLPPFLVLAADTVRRLFTPESDCTPRAAEV